MVTQEFGVIVADPPWRYRNFSDTVHGAAASHYATMDSESIREIPVKKWAAEDCVLALWGTWPKLDECFGVVRSWGFEYVTGFPWVKTNPNSGEIRRGIGFWTQSASECVLIGRRGDPGRKGHAPLIGLLIGEDRQFYAPRTQHSRKPETLQDWLEGEFPGPYLEMFATRLRPGWATWGRTLGYELDAAGVRRAGLRQIVIESEWGEVSHGA